MFRDNAKRSRTREEANDPVILGDNQIYSSDSARTQLNNNVMIVGSSGSGKSVSFMEPMLLHTDHSSIILTLSKRELVEKYAPWFEAKGYEVYDLNLANPEKSNVAFDPLRQVRNFADAKHMAMSVVMADPQKTKSNADPYWDKGGASLFCALTALAWETMRNPCFADVLDLLDRLEIDDRGSVIRTNLDDQFDRLKRLDPNCFAVTNWRTFKQLPIKTASCIFSTLNSTVDDMFTPELRKMMRRTTVLDFERLASRKSILFVTTSAVNPALHRFVNLFYGQAFKRLFEFAEEQPGGRLPVPVKILCDDFAVGSKIMNFPEMISIFRAKAISVMLLLQSESQLEGMYGHDDATTIINNCDTYVYLGGMDLRTCRNISERLNAPLEDVLYMPIGREFLFRRGQRPVSCGRYRTLEDELYQKVTAQYRSRLKRQRECA